MNASTRREKILARLKELSAPISATALARELGVSRQVIVGDIVILRAKGNGILSLARGYMLEKNTFSERALKLFHSDEDVEKELNLIVDHGGEVVDVFVYHRSYGLLRARMDIKSRLDVVRFLEEIKSGKSSLLKNVTSGYHYHTIRAGSEKVLDLIEKALEENGFLAPLQELEPSEINR
ncbi:MAG: transcription repressor NadR [Clostridia bacterium]|nr:transcription repressor NadR [Clostridia bacterium]